MLRKFIFTALLLAVIVITFGAYVRLSDAGLGCPDWPGCYGQLTPEHAETEINAAQQANPLGPVSMHKAWKEMTHRYLAATLGGLLIGIAALTWINWKRKNKNHHQDKLNTQSLNLLPFALLGVVVIQGLLGKWTVTLLLKPAIVSSHLLGGMTILALLSWLLLRESNITRYPQTTRALIAARIGLVLVCAQIALGGWVSTNYAALSCLDFPTCHNEFIPQGMAFGSGFHLFRELGVTADGAPLSLAALTAIHWTHRLGALIVAIYSLALAARFFKRPGMRMFCLMLVIAILIQISLGIANVMLKLPLPIAVAHNAGAVLLLITMVSFNYRMKAIIPVSSNTKTQKRTTDSNPISALHRAEIAKTSTPKAPHENLIT